MEGETRLQLKPFRAASEHIDGSADTDTIPAGRSLVARSAADVADKLARHEGRDDEQRTTQIRRWCEEAAQQFVDAPVQAFVPISSNTYFATA